jgi:hypothetical protein
LADADSLRQLLAGAGFTDIALDRVATLLGAPSFDAWWTRNLTVASPVVGILEGLDDATRARLKETVRAAVAPYKTNGSLELPGLALVLSGRRP